MPTTPKYRVSLGALATVLVIAAAAWQVRSAQRATDASAFPQLNASLEPLRADFNREAGLVRVVMLIDPT